MRDNAEAEGAKKQPGGPRCPICKEPTETKYRPFCSSRCADLDLGRWMKGAYALPAEEEDTPDVEDHRAAEEQAREQADRRGR